MTLHLKPEVAKGLEALAADEGLSVETFLQRLVERGVPERSAQPEGTSASGMIWEEGLLIYGAGTDLPDGFLNDALRRSREARAERLSGDHA